MASVLYGSTDTGTPGDLYLVDAGTGALTSVGPIGFCVRAMAEDPTSGILYGYVADDDPNNPNFLVSIDKTTGAGTLIGDTTEGSIYDLAFDSAGQLFGVQNFIRLLKTFDLVTGAGSTVGALSGSGPNGDTIAATSADDFFGMFNGYLDGGDLRTINVSAPSSASVATTSTTIGVNAFAMGSSFDPGDVLYLAVQDQDTFIGYLATLDTGTGVVTTIGTTLVALAGLAWGTGTAPPPPPAQRFSNGFPWRFLFTAIDVTDPFNPDVMETTSWADGLLTERRIAVTLGQATTIDAAVWPDDIRVNEIWTDGYPRVAPLKRMVWAFRREDPPGGPPWICRAAGILMSPQDEGDADLPLTHFTAYDPRKLLEGRPVVDFDGGLPGPDGFTIFDHGNVVALTYLANTIANEGGVFIDAGVAYGGTIFYGGTIVETPEIDFTVQQGSSVADVWTQLEQAGNCDIILTPIYDPDNRPGYTHEISIYALAGQEQPSAVFAWDKLNRSVTKISRVHDLTPGAFFNTVDYGAGQGGAFSAAMPLINAASVTAFGSVWQMQFFPTMTSTDPTGAAVLALAAQALQMAKQGKRTTTLEPTPERAPIVFIDYGLGDRVPVYATKRLRVTADGYQRVEGIPIEVTDDGVERIGGLLCSPDWRGSGDS